DPLPCEPITEVASGPSSSTSSPQTNVQPTHPMTYPNNKWTKDHPLNHIIGPLSRPISTRLQLHEQALFCYYDAFLTSVKPKTCCTKEYGRLSNGCEDCIFERQLAGRGSVDPTLFIRRNGNELLLMSMMGKISFFLGLQISQNPRGIFINQLKYALESLKKYGFKSCDPVDTPMVEVSKLDKDKEGIAVDQSHYRGSAYRKARTCSQKDLSIPSWNR
nr:hypothetical protein [Tanacetum cinerariifolium]